MGHRGVSFFLLTNKQKLVVASIIVVFLKKNLLKKKKKPFQTPINSQLFISTNTLLILSSSFGTFFSLRTETKIFQKKKKIKTSLLVRFVDGTFIKDASASLGVDYKIKDNLKVGERNVKLKVCDTAGQERFRTVTASFYR